MQRLGKGAQGSVFLVQHKEEKENYVLKKVECNDETEANKAFKEAMALNELRHPYVCGYKEFFVTWDKEESAMFVCIVMDHYKMGDLDRVLKQRRKHKQALEEIIIKKWLGQMVEALVFIHKKEVIHRDLKPSNIFLKEDLSISLGDFGVATIMGDKRTKTRTTVGSMNWMAPEVLERPYDERSDVWSLGCVTLEMITCHILDATQMSGHLFELKNNPQLLEDVLNRVGCEDSAVAAAAKATSDGLAADAPETRLYSMELCATIRSMLRRNFQQRPKAVELVDSPYVQECLRLNGSPLAKRVAGEEGAIDSNVPTNGDVDSVVAFLIDHQEEEAAVNSGLVELVHIAKTTNNFSVSAPGKRLILQLLKSYCSSTADIPANCCNIFSTLVINDDEDEILYGPDMIKAVVGTMRAHASSQNVQLAACELLMGLSADESACELVGRLGGIQDILAAMRVFHTNAQICAVSCSALWSLTVNENNARLVTDEKGISDVMAALKDHGVAEDANVDLVESACAALLSLSMEEENVEAMRQFNAMALLIRAISCHISNAMVVKNACLAMSSLAESDEISAIRVFKNPEDTENSDSTITRGLPTILRAYEIHKESSEVAEGICCLLLELSEYDDLKQVLTHYQLHLTLLKECIDKFGEFEEVKVPAIATLEKLTS